MMFLLEMTAVVFLVPLSEKALGLWSILIQEGTHKQDHVNLILYSFKQFTWDKVSPKSMLGR